ncbi:hypothetical protein [Halorubrum laminariae]|uniref:DUF541 domain-containing protein n=1 Tax=Halorubrum laminariae TaxID=1433523 RepID=A0ABD6BZR2_9EURY|nr:hypothetical protein [Halorubrum laminariae]
MTSTVLDVSVLLLCVSASVLALSPGGLETGAEPSTAGEIADRLSTETVTVTYADPSAPGGNRTVHATRAELLALLAVDAHDARGRSRGAVNDADTDDIADSDTVATDGFERQALAVVGAGLDARTRIDARIREGGSADRLNRSIAAGHPWSTRSAEATDSVTPSVVKSSTGVSVGTAPPRSADTTAAVITQPRPVVSATSDGHVRIVVRRW